MHPQHLIKALNHFDFMVNSINRENITTQLQFNVDRCLRQHWAWFPLKFRNSMIGTREFILLHFFLAQVH